jgi:signal transduction histidine kinase
VIVSLRQQQTLVFAATVIIIFGIFAAGLSLISQRLTAEATLQTALLMARQVEIALADSLNQRPAVQARPRPPQPQQSSFWGFLGNIFPTKKAPATTTTPPTNESRRTAEVRGLMRAFIDRSGSIEAMWVVNPDGKVLYSSPGTEKIDPTPNESLSENLRRGVTTINTTHQQNSTYYDVLVPLQMPAGVRGPGGLRLWINQASLTDLLSGLWRQLALLFGLGAAVALLSGFLTTALYTRRFRVISDALREAAAGTYAARPTYRTHDEVGKSLDLIDRLVMKQRKTVEAPPPLQRLAVAARTLAHEVRTPLNAAAIHLELLRNSVANHDGNSDHPETRSLAALDAGIRQVDRLVRDFSDYSAPVILEHKDVDVREILSASLAAVSATCSAQKIELTNDLPPGPWPIQGDGARLRQTFDNLLRNAMEAQPDGGSIHVGAHKEGHRLTLDFSDSGPGVPSERRAEIFEFGKTTKTGGNGIGLPLSQLIIESHGGSLIYQDGNTARQGAIFHLTLPLQEVH